MYPSRKKRDYWRYISHPLSLVALVIALILLSRGVYGIFEKERASRERFQITAQSYGEYMERKDFLDREIGRLQTDEGIEAEVREKFRVAKEDERLVVIVEPEGSGASEPIAEEASVWQAIKRFFGGE